jgi:hypothetical protein
MHPGLLLDIVTISLVYVAAAVWLVHAIRNSRAAWDRIYGRHTQGGEPLPGSLEKIRSQSALGLILLPILFIAGGFGTNLKLQQLERKLERERQQQHPAFPKSQQQRSQSGAASSRQVETFPRLDQSGNEPELSHGTNPHDGSEPADRSRKRIHRNSQPKAPAGRDLNWKKAKGIVDGESHANAETICGMRRIEDVLV